MKRNENWQETHPYTETRRTAKLSNTTTRTRDTSTHNIQFHNKVEFIVVLEHLEELEDVVVVQLLHDLNLTLQQFDVVTFHHALLDALDGELLTSLLAGSLHHDREATAPNLLSHVVVILHRLLAHRIIDAQSEAIARLMTGSLTAI
jgi:hypothetical protein